LQQKLKGSECYHLIVGGDFSYIIAKVYIISIKGKRIKKITKQKPILFKNLFAWYPGTFWVKVGF
jgi:hypothetical protein